MPARVVRVLALLVAVAGSSCGGAGVTSPSASASVAFRLDAFTCAPLGSVLFPFTFYVDDVRVGSGDLGLGGTSSPFRVSPGDHSAAAEFVNGGGRFSNLRFTAAAGEAFTCPLRCDTSIVRTCTRNP